MLTARVTRDRRPARQAAAAAVASGRRPASTYARTSRCCRPGRRRTHRSTNGRSPRGPGRQAGDVVVGRVHRAAGARIRRRHSCVTKWTKLDTRWHGVSVDTLLEHVEIDPGRLRDRLLRGGYTTNLPIPEILNGQAFVAWEYEAGRSAPEHGGPARLVVPHFTSGRAPSGCAACGWSRRPARLLGVVRLPQPRRPLEGTALSRRLMKQRRGSAGSRAGLRAAAADGGLRRRLVAGISGRSRRRLDPRRKGAGKNVRFAVPDWPAHRPGQHIDLSTDRTRRHQAQRGYSIASAPGMDGTRRNNGRARATTARSRRLCTTTGRR